MALIRHTFALFFIASMIIFAFAAPQYYPYYSNGYAYPSGSRGYLLSGNPVDRPSTWDMAVVNQLFWG